MNRTQSRAGAQHSRTRGRAWLIALALVLLLVAGAIAAGGYALLRPERQVTAGAPVEVVIERGSGTESIAQTLAEAGVVPNSLMFRVKARQAKVDGKLRAGTYGFETGMSYDAVLAKLTKGPDIVYYDVPIPEGFTAKQIAARFAKRAGVSEDEMLALVTQGASKFSANHPYLADAYNNSLEGYLFPATYRIKQGTSPEKIVEMMLTKFDDEIAGIDMSYAKSKNLTLQDVVIIGSILEREAQIADERPLVSSVIYNRLKARMRLQLCASVLYEMPPGTTKVTYEDTRRDGPYNTYTRAGLPAGPISNPGAAALRAAAQPKQTKYLYYVLTGKDGSQTFTTNYDDFLKAKAVYQKTFGGQ